VYQEWIRPDEDEDEVDEDEVDEDEDRSQSASSSEQKASKITRVAGGDDLKQEGGEAGGKTTEQEQKKKKKKKKKHKDPAQKVADDLDVSNLKTEYQTGCYYPGAPTAIMSPTAIMPPHCITCSSQAESALLLRPLGDLVFIRDLPIHRQVCILTVLAE
jgi:hypothetical protein